MDLEEKLKGLTKDQHIRILQVVVENDMDYTTNKNGIFINYTILKDKHKKIIEKFILNEPLPDKKAYYQCF
jgi:hypothetical protein